MAILLRRSRAAACMGAAMDVERRSDEAEPGDAGTRLRREDGGEALQENDERDDDNDHLAQRARLAPAPSGPHLVDRSIHSLRRHAQSRIDFSREATLTLL